MKVLTNTLDLPRWMKPAATEPDNGPDNGPDTAPTPPTAATASLFPEQGMPCSVLPRAVQDKLRAGQSITPAEAQPVPTRAAPSARSCRP